MATARLKPWEAVGFDRNSGVGSSDVGAILGVNPYRTGVDVWLEKRGLVPSFTGNEATKWGAVLEPIVAAEWARRRPGVRFERPGLVRHPQHAWAFCTPDRIAVMPDGTRMLVECKTAGLRQAPRWANDVPPEYLAQWTWQAWLCALPAGDVPVLIGGQEYREHAQVYDAEIGEAMAAQVGEWWARHVVAGREPTPDNARVEKRLLDVLNRSHVGDAVLATGQLEDAAIELREAKRIAKEAEALVTDRENRVKRLLGDKPGCWGPWGKVTWKAQKDGRRPFRPAFAGEEEF